jgi:hypothetical protein
MQGGEHQKRKKKTMALSELRRMFPANSMASGSKLDNTCSTEKNKNARPMYRKSEPRKRKNARMLNLRQAFPVLSFKKRNSDLSWTKR